MQSPFPGMDPYLEDPAFWADFHLRFITCWADILGERLPEPYEARMSERVNPIQMSPEVIRLIYPDVAVSKREAAPSRASGTSGTSGTLVLEPETIPHEVLEEVREAEIEILHRPDRSLVAVLELLSPWNKSGEGFLEYRAKRKAILRQQVHLVELDLLLGGQRLPLLRPLPVGDYYAFVSHAERRPDCDVFRWTVRDPLPALPIPLKAPDADLRLDLGDVFQLAFARGRYARSLRYGTAPPGPLAEVDRAWRWRWK